MTFRPSAAAGAAEGAFLAERGGMARRLALLSACLLTLLPLALRGLVAGPSEPQV